MPFSAQSARNPLFIIHLIEGALCVALEIVLSTDPLLTQWTQRDTEMVHATAVGFFIVCVVVLFSYGFDAPIDSKTIIIVALAAILCLFVSIVLLILSLAKEDSKSTKASFLVAILLFIAFLTDMVMHLLNMRRKMREVMEKVPEAESHPGPQPMVQTLPQAVGLRDPETGGEKKPENPRPPPQRRPSVAAGRAPQAARPRRRARPRPSGASRPPPRPTPRPPDRSSRSSVRPVAASRDSRSSVTPKPSRASQTEQMRKSRRSTS